MFRSTMVNCVLLSSQIVDDSGLPSRDLTTVDLPLCLSPVNATVNTIFGTLFGTV